MIPRAVIYAICMMATASLATARGATAQNLPALPVLSESPWNGSWVLSQTRNTAEIKDAAADGYRFMLQPDGRIRWEIPSLHEVVEGRTNGQPMSIRRQKPTALTLAVSAEGPRVLVYHVARAWEAGGRGTHDAGGSGQSLGRYIPASRAA